MADSKPVSETGWPYNDKVQCAKRIMEAVGTYHERPDALNRAALRSVVLTELDEYAAGVLVDYSFRCYSCSKEWEATTTTTDCPACGTTNNHCAANPRGVEGTKNG